MTYLLTARIRIAPAGMQGGLELCFSWGKTPSNFHQLGFCHILELYFRLHLSAEVP